jgi:hypothetical protein
MKEVEEEKNAEEQKVKRGGSIKDTVIKEKGGNVGERKIENIQQKSRGK